MALDLNRFSAKELKSLISQAKKQQVALSKRLSVTAVRKKLTAIAKAEGYNLLELLTGRAAGANNATAKTATAKKAVAKKTAKKTAKKVATKKTAKKAAQKVAKAGKAVKKVAPKYRNPDDQQDTWSGRGRKPLWMVAQLKKGKKAEEFLIKQ